MEIVKMQEEQIWKSLITNPEQWPFSGTKQKDVTWYQNLVQGIAVLNAESSYKPEGLVKKLKSMQNSMNVAIKKTLLESQQVWTPQNKNSR